MSGVQGLVFATAMAAVSGTAVVLFALKLQKALPPMPSHRRSCLSTGEKKGEKKKKKVRFAEDVVEPSGNNEEFRKRLNSQIERRTTTATSGGASADAGYTAATTKVKGMPANRAALYNGILRDRMNHRLAYSY